MSTGSVIQWKLPPIMKNIYASEFINPISADWPVTDLAPLSLDATNSAIHVREFDDTDEEGIAFNFYIPSGYNDLELKLTSRPSSLPGSTKTVRLKLYYRTIPDNSAIGSFNSRSNIDISISKTRARL